jgi:hypothetical protein
VRLFDQLLVVVMKMMQHCLKDVEQQQVAL